MIKFATLLLIFIEVAPIATQSEVENFLTDNGHHYVDIFFNHSTKDLLQLKPKNVHLAKIHIGKIKAANTEGFGVLFFDTEKDDLSIFLYHIAQRKIKMTLLIIVGQSRYKSLEILQNGLSKIEGTALFYILISSYGSGVSSWYQIISLNSGSAVNILSFADNSMRIIEDFNLENLELRSTSLTWFPYLIIEDCNKKGLDCKENYGFLIDYMELLAKKFNFTYISQKNMEDDWGVLPKSGPFNMNGTWGGVMGDVINKKYDLSISDWFWDDQRNELLEFVATNMNTVVLAMKPQHSDVDSGFFSRAFTFQSWVGMGVTTFAATLCLIVSHVLNMTGENDNGPKMIIFVSMVFFVIANAYYSGVLTMFFTHPDSNLFETETQAMQAFPEWRLLFLKGWEANIYQFAKQGFPEYDTYWERYKESPAEFTFNSIGEGLEHVEDGQNIMMINEKQLLAHLKMNPTSQQLYIFGEHKFEHRCLIFHKNSPLLPMFEQGVSHFREKGIEKELLTKWFGKEMKNIMLSHEGNILTLKQLGFVFINMAGIWILCLVVLCGEKVYRLVKKARKEVGKQALGE